jgi:hypothetical protein
MQMVFQNFVNHAKNSNVYNPGETPPTNLVNTRASDHRGTNSHLKPSEFTLEGSLALI